MISKTYIQSHLIMLGTHMYGKRCMKNSSKKKLHFCSTNTTSLHICGKWVSNEELQFLCAILLLKQEKIFFFSNYNLFLGNFQLFVQQFVAFSQGFILLKQRLANPGCQFQIPLFLRRKTSMCGTFIMSSRKYYSGIIYTNYCDCEANHVVSHLLKQMCNCLNVMICLCDLTNSL